jgi:hypothetical protein
VLRGCPANLFAHQVGAVCSAHSDGVPRVPGWSAAYVGGFAVGSGGFDGAVVLLGRTANLFAHQVGAVCSANSDNRSVDWSPLRWMSDVGCRVWGVGRGWSRGLLGRMQTESVAALTRDVSESAEQLQGSPVVAALGKLTLFRRRRAGRIGS